MLTCRAGGDQCKYAHEDTGYYADPPMLHRNGRYPDSNLILDYQSRNVTQVTM